MKDGEDYHSKICYLGTHALKKGVSGENIKETDNQLSSIIDEFKLQKRTFWSSPKPELTFSVFQLTCSHLTNTKNHLTTSLKIFVRIFTIKSKDKVIMKFPSHGSYFY